MAKKTPKKTENESGLPEAIRNTIDTLVSKGQKPLTISQTLDIPLDDIKRYLSSKPAGPKAGTLMARNKKGGVTIMTSAASQRGDESKENMIINPYEGKIHKIKED